MTIIGLLDSELSPGYTKKLLEQFFTKEGANTGHT